MRKAVNEPLMSLLGDGLDALRKRTVWDLERNSDAAEEREETVAEVGSRLLSIRRHACQMRTSDALEKVQDTLGFLMKYCTEQKCRNDVNLLNGIAFKLDGYLHLTLKEMIRRKINPDSARISREQADRSYEIAQVQGSSGAPAADREANFHRAIDGYKRALQFYTQTRNPAAFANAQNNLENAYARLSEVRDKEGNLGKAIAAYGEALKVRTLDAFPVSHVGTMFSIGLLQLQAGDLPKAERSFQDAEQVFRNQGMIELADRVHKAAEPVREQTSCEKE